MSTPAQNGITPDDLPVPAQTLFDKYKTRSVYSGPVAKVNLASHPGARKYRTVLRESVQTNGANFAGYLSLVEWGCGSSCAEFALVDVRTGRVYFPPKEISNIAAIHVDVGRDESESDYGPFRYRLDSNLLILMGIPGEDADREGILLYRWNGKALVHVQSIRIKRDFYHDPDDDPPDFEVKPAH